MARINGVWINGKHSYRDYGLYFSRRPEIESAAPKLKLVDVPGGDGTLDYTEAIDGTVKYANRRIAIDFFAIVDIPKQAELKARLKSAWHGRIIELEFDEEPGWIYKGRATVTPQDITPHTMHFVLDVDAEPYAIAKDYVEVALDRESRDDGIYSTYNIPHQDALFGEEEDSLFRFNDGQHAYTDLSFFSVIKVLWEPEVAKHVACYFYIKDVDGNWFSSSSLSGNGDDARYAWYSSGVFLFRLGALDGTGVDVTKISRIRMSHVPNARLEAKAVSAGKTIVINDDMPVVPEFTKTSTISGDTTPSTLYVNGATVKIPANAARFRDASAVLLPGENEIFVSPSDAELRSLEVTVAFKPGRL